MTAFKLFAIGVLVAVMLAVIYLNHRASRRPPRVGRPLDHHSHGVRGRVGADNPDGSDPINAALIAAVVANAGHSHHARDHGSPASHSHDVSHHGGFDAGSHGGGGADGGGGGAN